MNCVKCGTQLEEGSTSTLCAACQALETPTQDLNVPADPPADAPAEPAAPEAPAEAPITPAEPPVEPTDTPDENPPISGIQ
ncbi:MAG: hypothetical protein V1690_02230 [Candidatus Moraniibacteriota bacterium]